MGRQRIFQNLYRDYRPADAEMMIIGIGIFLVYWYGWHLDDAYVYFRYVDNLVIHGDGLVYNRGEYVEGFSSPLWAGMLIVLRALELNYWVITRMVGIACFILFAFLAIFINRKAMPDDYPRERSFNIPLVYLGLLYGVSCYFTSGLETPFLLVVSAAFAAFCLAPENRAIQVMVGLAPMVRHELALPFIIVSAWFIYRQRRLPWTMWGTCALTLGGYMIFRIWYYADLFPNTFYLKDEIWITQGLAYIYESFLTYHTVPYLLAAGTLYLVLRRRNPEACRHEARVMMWATGVPVLLYVIKIGGDPRHFRYLIFPFCMLVFSSAGLVETLLGDAVNRYRTTSAWLLAAFALAVFSCYPRQLQQHPLFRRHHFEHRTFLLIGDAAHHRFHPRTLTPPLTGSAPGLAYANATDDLYRLKGDLFCTSQCDQAYYARTSPVVHSLGLCEPFLARTIMKTDRPAHKLGLMPLGEDIKKVREVYGFVPGAFQKAVDDGMDLPWIAANLEVFKRIEEKVYNRHNFFENLGLALRSTGRIDPKKPR